MTANQTFAFSGLLDAWRRHEDLRTSHASFQDLAEARRILDSARTQMALSRNHVA